MKSAHQCHAGISARRPFLGFLAAAIDAASPLTGFGVLVWMSGCSLMRCLDPAEMTLTLGMLRKRAGRCLEGFVRAVGLGSGLRRDNLDAIRRPVHDHQGSCRVFWRSMLCSCQANSQFSKDHHSSAVSSPGLWHSRGVNQTFTGSRTNCHPPNIGISTETEVLNRVTLLHVVEYTSVPAPGIWGG